MTPKKRLMRLIAALRSGKYKQGRFSRKTGYGKSATYCPIGVAQALFKVPSEDAYDKVKRLLGMNDVQQNLLISRNDSRRQSFAVIADWLEEKILPEVAG